MSYQVIARKYRPQRFSDVVGQEHVTRTLSQAIEQSRIAHAYLFCGPRGTGKTTVARIFAKCLNATDGPKVDFAETDPRAQEIAEGRSLDVLEIDGASNNGVEQVRELRDTCRYAPATSRFKIYIIDEVHMLSTAAFNALLKTLEEPPAHVKFLFATTDPEKVLPTILSRCQRFDLRRIPSALIVKHLAHIAAQEKVTVDPAALHAIARGAEGGMRDAESTLDQLISFCGEHIVEADVLSMFGLTAQSQIIALCRHILEGNIHPALRELDDLSRKGKDLGRLLGDLLNHFRNLLIYTVSKGDLSMMEVSEAEATALAEQAPIANSDGLARILEVFTDTEVRLKDATSKKILVEVALLKAVDARNATSLDTVLRELNNLRGGGSPGGQAPKPAAQPARAPQRTPGAEPSPIQSSAMVRAGDAPVSVTPVASAPASSSAPATPVATTPATHDLETLWEELVNAVGQASSFMKSHICVGHPVSFSKNVFIIGFDPAFEAQMELADTPRLHQILKTRLADLGHSDPQIKLIRAAAPPGRKQPPADPEPAPQPVPVTPRPQPAATARSAPTAPAEPPKDKTVAVPFNKDDFKNDPLIHAALEIFKAQVSGVRAQT